MAERLTVEERKMLTQLFLAMDDNGNGWLSREELKEGLQAFIEDKCSDFEIEEFFREVDKNKDGKIQLDEFLNAMGHCKID